MNPVKFCPITGNNPLTCTKSGFLAACDKFRQLPSGSYANKWRRFNQYCMVCKGQIPDNVTFIELSEQLKEKYMGQVKKYVAVCQSCGEKKTVTNHCGEPSCSSCLPIRIGARNYPERVIAALKCFGNMPEIGAADDLKMDNSDNSAELKAEIKTLKEQLKDALILIDEKDRDIFDLKQALDTPNAVVAAVSPHITEKLTMDEKERFNDIAWKMAEGIMDGGLCMFSSLDVKAIRDIGRNY